MGYATDYTVDSKVVKRDVKYTNKDFASIRSGLIEFAFESSGKLQIFWNQLEYKKRLFANLLNETEPI